ncbi:hypothetical protein LTR70_000982 [Exophiala xenobiotica]|uniref:Uncharacterized protein n=1 Tax=Lithohypha guttulata TaxID=1690604 RepID=A0ABR0K0I1_9EURO|nr:hypothetical protein LTR24_008259 [Lithohypha guttulata]KAK5329145.1 hypothetical protein LTR70_000982 [Exophiala xenobiotica]
MNDEHLGGAGNSDSQAMTHSMTVPDQYSSNPAAFGPTPNHGMQLRTINNRPRGQMVLAPVPRNHTQTNSTHTQSMTSHDNNALISSPLHAAVVLNVRQMYAQQYIGEGTKSEEDVISFLENGYFQNRSLQGAEVCVHYAVLTNNGRGFSTINALIPAEQCDHINKLKHSGHRQWSKVFKDLGQMAPPAGVKAEQVSVEARESFNENTFSFYEMQGPHRYSCWFTKNAYHGRARKLHVRLTCEMV